MSTAAPKHFDVNAKNRLEQAEEVQIETRQPGASSPAHRATIWVVVVGDDVFVRSVRGTDGRWYQEIKTNPLAVVHVDGQHLRVKAMPVTDNMLIARVSDEYQKKYGTSAYLPPLMRPEVLPTTLRLEPM
jgi:hypothetical protein